MKIELNEQQVQRRIYNRTEQFKLLTEKNPALEKLRKALNLDFAWLHIYVVCKHKHILSAIVLHLQEIGGTEDYAQVGHDALVA